MDKADRKRHLEDLKNDLPKQFPGLAGLDDVLNVARQLARKFFDVREWECMTVQPIQTDEGDDVIRVCDENGSVIGQISDNEQSNELVEAMVVALKMLHIPARLKETKLVVCPICEHYHPTDFNGDCRDNRDRFPAPYDSDDITTHFDNGDPGTDFLESEDAQENRNFALDLLENLLSITEKYKNQMDPGDQRQWDRISAQTADLRAGIPEDGDDSHHI